MPAKIYYLYIHNNIIIKLHRKKKEIGNKKITMKAQIIKIMQNLNITYTVLIL